MQTLKMVTSDVDSATPWENLQTPEGSTIRLTATEDLCRQFHNLGIEGAHTLGRDVLCRRYSEMLRKIHDDAGSKAVTAFLESKRI